MATENSKITAVFRYLSGPHRGQVVRLEGKTLFILRRPSGELIITPPNGHPISDSIAILHKLGSSYELVVNQQHNIWANGNRVTEKHQLQSGDLIELGELGMVLRYRFYQNDFVPKKSVAEALADSMDSARADSKSGLGVTGHFITRFTNELATQTTLWFRIWMLLILTLLLFAIIALVLQNYHFQKQLSSESIKIESIARVLKQTGAEAMTGKDLGRMRQEIEQQLTQTAERIALLEARGDAIATVISSSTESIAFVQGTYGYLDAATGRALRFIRAPEGMYLFTFDEIGEIVDIPFSGTAFIASDTGLLLTNKHIVEPWIMSDDLQPPENLKIEPLIQRMRAFFPGENTAVTVTPKITAETSDLAILQPEKALNGIKHLSLELKPPVPGDGVVVMGYPFGLSGVLARASQQFVEETHGDEQLDFWGLGDKLAKQGYIKPLASRGIVSQLTENYIAYDAETAMGGSGGPVLNLDGKVVAVNTATMKGFGGSNLGVPASYISRLLQSINSD